jgi:ABC-type branched-subunit amino acid transport system ATPase component
MEILKLSHVSREFGGIKAVNDVSLTVKENAIHGIIGPNGSGKTTLFNVISGYYKPTHGEVYLGDEAIHPLSPYQICRKGLARTFQNLRLFKKMTAIENVAAVLDRHANLRVWDYFFRINRVLRAEKEIIKQAEELLKTFDLMRWRDIDADSLPYGVQKRLEIARALATKPSLLLLDEPAAGLNHTETDELSQVIKHIRDNLGITVILIEHDMKLVMSICDQITVLNEGSVICEGPPKVVGTDKQVITAYLGGEV